MRNPEGKFSRHLEDWSITESSVADGGQVTDIVFLPLPLYQGRDDLFQISRGPWWGGDLSCSRLKEVKKPEEMAGILQVEKYLCSLKTGAFGLSDKRWIITVINIFAFWA